MKSTATVTAGALVLGMLLAAGCSSDPTKGYTLKSQYPEGIKTVTVPIWHRGKKVYRRGLEMRLTESVVKRLELDTPYKVTDKSRADTELRGTIDLVSQRVLSFNPDSGLPREREITVAVSFTWTDLRNGKVLARRTNFRQAGTYISPAPFGEDFFQGSEDVVNKLAQRIVEQMEADW
ncbi:MAG TPA: LPS assembly lipoprotein LptE [Phycisphaerae bacterium]|nr:LPS assembly lipoprotein LptE [Phycisphaerae bacterium]